MIIHNKKSKIDEITKKFFSKSILMYKLFPQVLIFYIRKTSAQRLDKLFLDILKILSVRNFIDCGANVVGDTQLEVAKMGLHVLAIEPNPTSFKNMRLKSSKQFKKINIGLSDKEELLKFYVLKNIKTATNANFHHPKNKLDQYDVIEVPVTRLDKLLKNSELTTCSFALWIDVEGMQKEMLTGAQETLKNLNCNIIKIEVESKRIYRDDSWLNKDIEKFFINLGYVAIYRDFEYLKNYNIIFVKKNDAVKLEVEINKAFIDVAESINFFKIIRYLVYFFLLRRLKKLVIKIFGVRIGKTVSLLFRSKRDKSNS